jgi:hypothetical protein
MQNRHVVLREPWIFLVVNLAAGMKCRRVEMLQEPAWKAREMRRGFRLHWPAKKVGANEMNDDLLLRSVVATEMRVLVWMLETIGGEDHSPSAVIVGVGREHYCC